MERLEFLGDAVVGLAVSAMLVRQHPAADEGQLTRLRARLVNTVALARKAREVGLPELLILGKGEENTGGRNKPSILAGALEAVVGALFLDGGFDAALRVAEDLFGGDCSAVADARGLEDPKTALQEATQRLFRCLPAYKTIRVSGPEHARTFVVEVSVGERMLGQGQGRSKRGAAQAAAREALRALPGASASAES